MAALDSSWSLLRGSLASTGRRISPLPHGAASLLAVLALVGGLAPLVHGDSSDHRQTVRLATTTSTDNSGLLEQILPQFERDTGYAAQVISVGTGKALRLGESGDVDALLVHAPQSEQRFIQQGHGVYRKSVMANDFILLGPPADPAGLRGAASARDAFRKLHTSASLFVSRGDDSGTHKKELALWKAAGITDWGAWRLEVGQGMGNSLQIADELRAYLLIDRATWLFLQDKTTLALLYEGDRALHNPYGVMAVNPRRRRVNFAAATALIDWLTSPVGQAAIGAYRLNGIQLFIPTASAEQQ